MVSQLELLRGGRGRGISKDYCGVLNESRYCQKCRNATLRNAKMHVRRMTMNLIKKFRLAAETRCALFRFTALDPVEGEVDDDMG